MATDTLTAPETHQTPEAAKKMTIVRKFPLENWQRAAIYDHLARAWPSIDQGEAWCARIGWDVAWLIVASENNLFVPEELRASVRLPLKKQAAALNVKLESIVLGKSPQGFAADNKFFQDKEDAVANCYRPVWPFAIFDEGATVCLLTSILIQKRASELAQRLGFATEPYEWRLAGNFFHGFRKMFVNCPPDSHEGRLAADAMEYLAASPRDIFHGVEGIRQFFISLDRHVDRRSPYHDPRELQAPCFLKYAEPMWLLLQNAGSSFFPNLIRQHCKYGQFGGWPDLTLIRDGGIGFCEVKDKDKLHASQVAWWALTFPVLSADGWIAKITYHS